MKTSGQHMENLWEIRTKPDGNGKTIEKPRGNNEKTMWAPLENRWKTHAKKKQIKPQEHQCQKHRSKKFGISQKNGGMS